MFFQDLFHFFIQSQVDQVVGQQLSDKEFCGNIIQLLLSLVPGKFLGLFFCQYH